MTDNKTKQLTILVIDNHEIFLNGITNIIEKKYSEAKIISTQNVQEILTQVSIYNPNAVIMDLVISEQPQMSATIEMGISLLQQLMSQYPTLNIMVQSCHINALTRIKNDIDNHQGGFTIANKNISSTEMLQMLDWCLKGITHTKKLKTKLEITPECLELLSLACKQCLQDNAIATKMYKSKRMIRNYWGQLQNMLEVYPDENQNLRILTLMRAREKGLID